MFFKAIKRMADKQSFYGIKVGDKNYKHRQTYHQKKQLEAGKRRKISTFAKIQSQVLFFITYPFFHIFVL